LAGFAKSADLAYLLAKICDASYEHDVNLAPTAELLDAYRKKQIDWPEYERSFHSLMEQRQIPANLDRAPFERKTVLLCSEATPDKCHRRLVAGLLAAHWGAGVEHL
jgi:uncharacterized protein YeaO (DUF488 family)